MRTFSDATAPFGVAGSGDTRDVLFADFDGDGRVDLLIVAASGNTLLHNGGAQRFSDANGITLSGDNRTLYVAFLEGIARVDVRTGAVERFAQPLQLGTRPELDYTWAFDGTRIFAGTACPELD